MQQAGIDFLYAAYVTEKCGIFFDIVEFLSPSTGVVTVQPTAICTDLKTPTGTLYQATIGVSSRPTGHSFAV